ncbi:MAG: EthD family reductase [Cyclobacteriaceae bacterium]|nr:EthD family reductase [Cyclobacteriaceae bacterium]
MNPKVILALIVIGTLVSCEPPQPESQPAQEQVSAIRKGMIKVTIMYPSSDTSRFDMDYYSTKHMPMVARLLGDSLKTLGIDKGIAGGAPDAPLPYMAIGYLYFDRLSAYQNSIAPHVDEIRSDFPNYTNVRPVILVSEVIE